jgi:prophage regulatory protein
MPKADKSPNPLLSAGSIKAREKGKSPTLLRISSVMDRTGLPASSLYALIAAGKFPKPIKLSERRAAWIESEVEDWINARIAESMREAG